MPKLPTYTVNNNIHPKLPPQTNQIQNPTSTKKKEEEKQNYPNGDFVGIGYGMGLVRIDHAVLSHRHGIGLYVFGDALGLTRLQVEPN